MNPQQRYLKRFAVSVAGMYGIQPAELAASSHTNAIEARRIVMIVGADVFQLGPTQIGDVLGISKALVRHHTHEMRGALIKNKPLRSVVKACKALAERDFVTYCEGIGTREAAE